MKPILLLGPALPGASPAGRWRLDVQRITPADDATADAAAYSAVVVVNDGSADTVRRLQTALRLRGHPGSHPPSPGPRIGVLSYLGDAARHEVHDLEPRLRIGMEGEVISFEYQAG